MIHGVRSELEARGDSGLSAEYKSFCLEGGRVSTLLLSPPARLHTMARLLGLALGLLPLAARVVSAATVVAHFMVSVPSSYIKAPSDVQSLTGPAIVLVLPE